MHSTVSVCVYVCACVCVCVHACVRVCEVMSGVSGNFLLIAVFVFIF